MVLLGFCAIADAGHFTASSKILPIASALILIGAALFTVLRIRREPPATSPSMSLAMGLAFALLVATAPFVGLMPASLGFLWLVRKTFAERWTWMPAVLIAVGLFQVLMVEGLIGTPLRFGIFGTGLFR